MIIQRPPDIPPGVKTNCQYIRVHMYNAKMILSIQLVQFLSKYEGNCELGSNEMRFQFGYKSIYLNKEMILN